MRWCTQESRLRSGLRAPAGLALDPGEVWVLSLGEWQIITTVPILIGKGARLFGSLSCDLRWDVVRTEMVGVLPRPEMGTGTLCAHVFFPQGMVKTTYKRKR
jgi:hypothetical protein